jgi:histidine triad (HIT) family protein
LKFLEDRLRGPCVFCEVVAGSRSQPVVLDEPEVLAFMDLRQPSQGHVLVIPKRHIENIFELDEAAASPLMAALAKVARAVRAAFEPDGVSIWSSNGPGAHQEVPHLHLHVMPRFVGDGLLRIYPQPPETPDGAELKRQADLIRASLAAR